MTTNLSGTRADTTDARVTSAQIVEHLGGRKIYAMAFSGVSYDTTGMTTFSIAAALRRMCGATHVFVSLMPNDTYAVRVIKLRGTEMKVVGEAAGLHAAQLRSTVESLAKLRLGLS